jgi:hypothetical protein
VDCTNTAASKSATDLLELALATATHTHFVGILHRRIHHLRNPSHAMLPRAAKPHTALYLDSPLLRKSHSAYSCFGSTRFLPLSSSATAELMLSIAFSLSISFYCIGHTQHEVST